MISDVASTAPVHEWSAVQQSRAIRGGELTVSELTAHYLARTADLDPQVGAFAYVAAEEAMEQAAELDRRLAVGQVDEADALFGCVAPVKDLDLVAGMPCSFGSRAVTGFVPPMDAEFVTRMRAAGLVITGKTATPEFGLPAYTENEIGHVARTPWDLTRSAGGSSGGAAAAVSARLASVAQGSDGGGSIRIPASVTGLVGIKPSRGRVSELPMQPGVGELAVIGPLARTVADAAAFLDVIAGSSPADINGLPTPTPGSYLAAAQRDPGLLRIGSFAEPMIVDTEVHPAALAAWQQACELLAMQGHEVVAIPRPIAPHVVGAFETVWRVGAAAIPIPVEREHLLTPLTRHLRRLGSDISAVALAHAVTTMRTASSAALAATADFDLLITPALAQLPAPVGRFTRLDPADDFEEQKRFTPFTSPFNVTGQPAMSVPFHHTDEGLPVGVQLVGRPADEWTMISVAAQMERELGWHARVPPVAGPGGRHG